jgi:hypothetical protein
LSPYPVLVRFCMRIIILITFAAFAAIAERDLAAAS